MNAKTLFAKDGKIVKTIFSNVHFVCDDNLNVIDGFFDADNYYIDNIDGSFVAVEKKTKPSENHKFDYSLKEWVDTRTIQMQWDFVRQKRNHLLSESDWTQLSDVSLVKKEAFAQYRQALRDVTNQPDPFTIQWPQMPE